MLLELIRYVQLLCQTLTLLFSISFSLGSSYTNQCKGNGLQVQGRHPQSSSGWDAVLLPPSPSLPPSCLCPKSFSWTVSRSELFLFVCAVSKLKVEWQIVRITETSKLVFLDWGMQLHSCIKWRGLMLVFETGKTTIIGLNSRKLLWFLIYERKNSIFHLPLTSRILSLLFCTVCEGLKSLSYILKIIFLL